jgi:DNA primase
MEMLSTEGLKVRVALMPKGEDPDTLLRTAGAGAVQKAVEGGLTPLEYKIRALDQRLSPTEEQYWAEAVAAIASSNSEMERTRYIERLAYSYPEIKDFDAARKALARMVAAAARKNAAPAREAETHHAVVAVASPVEEMHRIEIAFFQAFLSEEHRNAVWSAMLEDDLFLTGAASRLGGALIAAFPDFPPIGKPAEWIGELDPKWQEVLTEVNLSSTLLLNPGYVQDTIRFLQKKREARQLKSLRRQNMDEQELKTYLARLNGLKED